MEERIKDLLEEKNYKILKTELANMNSSDIAEILRNHNVTEDETNSFDVTSDDAGFDAMSSPSGGGMDFGGPPSMGSDMEFSSDFSEEPSAEPEITPEA